MIGAREPVPGPAWSVLETTPGGWWAVDAGSGMAYSVTDEIGDALWLLGDPGRSLSGELNRAASGPAGAASSTVELEFAGVVARYVCEDAATAARLRRDFAACVPRLRSTPDLLVRISNDADVDKLHRALPGERAGVATRRPHEAAWVDASGHLPVLPPVQRTRLADEYAALHAALVLTPRGPVIVAGPQRSGKTTAAVIAEQSGLGTASTDELVLLGRHGLVYGVPLPMRVRTEDDRKVRPVLPGEVLSEQPRRAAQLVLLDHAGEGLSHVGDAGRAMAALAEHLRPLDRSLGATAVMALELLAGVTTWRLSCRPWPHLADDLRDGLTDVLESVVA